MAPLPSPVVSEPLLRQAAGSGPVPAARPPALGWPWVPGLVLLVLPVVLALGFYFRPGLLPQQGELPVSGDAPFYIYQFARVAELEGRWWQLGPDERIGAPYPTAAAKHPGLYEGLDLLLVSSLTGRFLPPVLNYHLLVLLALALNGWVAGWLVYRATRSTAWAALAIALITVNVSIAIRLMAGHPHLLRLGWVLLAVWGYLRYLERPSWGRGVALGLLAALVLASSYHFGILLLLALGTCALGELLLGRLTRRHLRVAGLAALVFGALAAAVTFPGLLQARQSALAEGYFRRSLDDVWACSADLVQYVLPPTAYPEELAQRKSCTYEGWHYPGLLVLLTLLLFLFRGRRHLDDRELGRRLDRLLGLAAVLVLLSLAGGPSALLYRVVPGIRCYGRAGMLAVALCSVVVPLVLWSVSRTPRGRARVLPWAVAGLLAFDGLQVAALFHYTSPPTPAWVTWLARQPATVRLIAFLPADELNTTGDAWNWGGLYYRTLHPHATLNGCDLALLEQDLAAHGASYRSLTPAALRHLVQQGYTTLAFHARYLDSHRWIRTAPWLQPVAQQEQWTMYQVRLDPAPAPRPGTP